MRPIKLAFVVLLVLLLSAAGVATAAAQVPPDLPICPDLGPYQQPSEPPKPLAPGERAACRAKPGQAMTLPSGRGPAGQVRIQTAGYHYLGASTDVANKLGVWGRRKVTNPATRVSTGDFVASRFLAWNNGTGQWIETGWIERSGGRQCVYYGTHRGEFQWCDQYPIADGNEIYQQISYIGFDPPRWAAYLWWNGQWVELANAELDFSNAPIIENMVEVYTVDGVHYFLADTYVGTPIQVHTSGAWADWRWPSQEWNVDDPYETHWLSKYDWFYVHRH